MLYIFLLHLQSKNQILNFNIEISNKYKDKILKMQNERFKHKPYIQHRNIDALKVLRNMSIGVIKHFHARTPEELSIIRNKVAYLNGRDGRWSAEWNKEGKYITVTRIL